MAHRAMPTELLERILKYVDFETLKESSLANRRCYAITAPLLEEAAWASCPVKDIPPLVNSMRKYKKVRLEGRHTDAVVWSSLYFYDFRNPIRAWKTRFKPPVEPYDGGRRIECLELCRTDISEKSLLALLRNWPTVHTLVLRNARVHSSWRHNDELEDNSTVKHLRLIDTSHVNGRVFADLETLVIRRR